MPFENKPYRLIDASNDFVPASYKDLLQRRGSPEFIISSIANYGATIPSTSIPLNNVQESGDVFVYSTVHMLL